jgi:hypothetical protein
MHQAALILATLALSVPAFAQTAPGRPTRSPTAPTQPAPTTPAPMTPDAPTDQAAPKREPPKFGPFIEQSNWRDLALTVNVRVNSDSPKDKMRIRDPFTGEISELPVITPFEFRTLAMIFPVLPSTGSSDPYPREVRGSLALNGRVVDESPEYMTGYPGGVRYARFDAGDNASTTMCRQVQLELVLPMRCYRTRYDEAAALRVPWPTGPWPDEAASVLKPQLHIETGIDSQGKVREFDPQPVKDALAQYLAEERIRDARRVNPAALAKILTGKVWSNMQVDGEGLASARTGEIAGLDLKPPAWTLRDRKGSPHDVSILLAALMREAGLPARVVVGWDVSSSGDKFLKSGSRRNALRAWVEFCLYDEANNTINWVPVDVVRMLSTTSRPPPLTQNWRFFGTHPDLDSVAPFAFHYHPPTDVVSYGYPGFWGWFVTPTTPGSAEQFLRFSAAALPVRGGEPPRDPKRVDEPPPRRRP